MLAFTHMWSRGYKLINIGHELGIGHSACVDWASFCREICLQAYIEHPEQLGGPGKTVEIDESRLGRRKFYRGHHVDGCWVFGGIERESGRVFMEVVEKRYFCLSLVSIIFQFKRRCNICPFDKKWMAPKTTVISDC